jgi:hypothetical protein
MIQRTALWAWALLLAMLATNFINCMLKGTCT